MNESLLAQLADYGRDHRANQDPIEIDGQLPLGGADAVVVVLETIDDENDDGKRSDMRNKWTLRAVALAAAVAAIVVGIMVFDDDDATIDTAAQAEPSPAEIVEAYFTAYNAGDEDAVLALLSDDATFAEAFEFGPLDESPRIQMEMWLAWALGQGTRLDARSCQDDPVEQGDEQGESTTITCNYEVRDAPTQAADAPSIVTTARFTVTASGISRIEVTYASDGGIDFLHVGEHFRRWLNGNHPDFACLAVSSTSGQSCDDPTSVEEERTRSALVAEYAQLWSVYLEENGCSYTDLNC